MYAAACYVGGDTTEGLDPIAPNGLHWRSNGERAPYDALDYRWEARNGERKKMSGTFVLLAFPGL